MDHAERPARVFSHNEQQSTRLITDMRNAQDAA